MNKKNFAFSALLAASVVLPSTVFAGGAASIVAKNSSSKGYTYSASTRLTFVSDCAKSANKEICNCVMDKIQAQYSEADYLQLDADLSKGKDRPDFTAFVSDATVRCDAEVGGFSDADVFAGAGDKGAGNNAAAQLTEADARTYAAALLAPGQKVTFTEQCAQPISAYLSLPEAKKMCGCAYDRMAGNQERLVEVFMKEGYPTDDGTWGADYIIECAPEKFTPAVSKAFVKACNDNGAPLSLCQCMFDNISKEYTFRSFLKTALNKEAMSTLAGMLILRCAAGL